MRTKDGKTIVDIDSPTAPRKERRNASMLSKRIYDVVNDVFVPFAHPVGDQSHGLTRFTCTERENITLVLKDVLVRDCPSVMTDRALFLLIAGEAYDLAGNV